MLNTYHMFPVNLALLSLLLLFVLVYKLIFPKKRVNLLLVLILIAVISVISVLRNGVYESGDFALHLNRAIPYYESLSEGNLIPSWADILNANYGYPLFIFINHLPYFLIGVLHLIGISFIASMKFYLMISYVFSGIFMYLFVKKLYKNPLASFIASLLYLFSPYHLIDQHFRVAIGEITLFTTLPLLLYSILLFIEKKAFNRALFVTLCTSLVVLSHQAMAFFGIIVVLIFTLFINLQRKEKKKNIAIQLALIFLGVIVSSFSLYPYLFYGVFVQTSGFNTMIFSGISEILLSPYRFGLLFQGPEGELRTIIGYPHVLIVGLSLFLYKKSGLLRNHVIFYIAIVLLFIFLILPMSKWVWETVPFIHLLIISSRMLLFISLFISLLGAVFYLNYLKQRKTLTFLLISGILLSSILNWGARGMVDKNDASIIAETPLSSSGNEGWGIGITKWIKPPIFESEVPKEAARIIKGSGIIVPSKRTTTSHTYSIKANGDVQVLENTWYFPGWNVFIDDKKSLIYYNNQQAPGIITFTVPNGLHKVEVIYEDLLVLRLLKNIAIAFYFGVGIYYFIYFAKRMLKSFYKYNKRLQSVKKGKLEEK